MQFEQSVCAVVVTFNRLPMLKKTLRYLELQNHPLQKIIVVDNASSDGTDEFLKTLDKKNGFYEVHRLIENSGGAGGFSYGMSQALNSDFDWIWVMDDDAFTSPDCLYKLLTAKTAALVRVPIQIDDTGRRYGLYGHVNGIIDLRIGAEDVQKIGAFTFVGPLFARHVVESVGLPRADFFICADDWEYAVRIKRMKFEMTAVTNAVINHVYAQGTRTVCRLGRRSIRSSTPAWKLYYSSRNELVIDLQNRSHLRQKARIIHHLYRSARLIPGEIFYDPDGMQRFKYRVLGLWDGLKGRMGKQVEPGSIVSRVR